MKEGFFLVFESAPKCGKTTLARLLADKIFSLDKKQLTMSQRGALSQSDFSKKMSGSIKDIGYSTAFYWADLIFSTADCIAGVLQKGGIVIQDRYDLSIITYREVHGFKYDYLLLDEYLKREMIVSPNLTVFLNPPLETILKRIRESNLSSSVDKEFFDHQEMIKEIQLRIKQHLKRLERNYITLDTEEMSCEECVSCILDSIHFKGDDYET